ncbi:MAG: hypothetical protein ACOX8P_01985 [Tepidanaerobacteraceae bacterium]|jgi:hypothetical protein
MAFACALVSVLAALKMHTPLETPERKRDFQLKKGVLGDTIK